MSISIVKADGSTEIFKEGKLRQSLRRAGATNTEIEKIVVRINTDLYSGIKTQEIYRKAFLYLQNSEAPTAARYSLRRALFGLGPTGFPFEDFLARLFQSEGYKTKTRIIIKGACIEHELDVAAYKTDHSLVAEAKFHARPGIKSDLQVALYSYARQLDLQSKKICKADICGIKEFWLITNTKFTSSAERYATCAGLQLLSWDYPKGNTLHDRIQKAGLYPITVLTTLTASHKKILLAKNIIICSDLLRKPKVLQQLSITSKKTDAVLSEARQLCG